MTAPEHDPAQSPVVAVVPSQASQVDVTLFPSGQMPENIDPMTRNRVSDTGAQTAADAIRLAQVQNVPGTILDTQETHLQGEYDVNYMLNGKLYSAPAQLNHDAWQLNMNDGR